MNIEFWSIGKTKESYLIKAQDIYRGRLKHYCKNNWIEYPEVKNAARLKPNELKKKEGALILAKLNPSDYLVLMDEKGKEMGSIAFSKQIQKWQNSGLKRIVFVIGGAFGFDEKMYQRANFKLSLSQMTFSHQMIRVFLLEQVYRAMTILKNEKYHNE